MNVVRRAILTVLLLTAATTLHAQLKEVGDGTAGPFKAEHLTAELTTLSPTNQIAPGGHLIAGLSLTLEEHWHVYWINAGDAGLPPDIKWTLPKGITAGPMQFPPPQRIPLGPLMDYGYEDSVTFPIELTAAPGLKPGKVHLDAKVGWIICSDRCIPGKAHLGLDLNVVPGPLAEPPSVGALGESLGWLPKPLPAEWHLTATGDATQIALTFTGDEHANAEFYPFEREQIANAADQLVEPLPDGLRLRLQRATKEDGSGQIAALPTSLHGLLKLGKGDDATTYEVTLPVTVGTIPPPSPSAKKVLNTPEHGAPAQITIYSAIGLAFLGGLILNLMPCVFPVLFIKGLALVNSSTEERSRQRLHGIIYTLGILVSFWAIVATLLLLRDAGHHIGWGFQLQSPTFVGILAMLVFFLGLSLAGQFELGLSLTSAGGELAEKQGLTGSFFTGVLATVVATPCAGPFMGAAIGFALAQPGWLTFVIFTALALGLALPYLALTMQPQWTRLLPRPGAWMEYLKQFTAIPLFGTAIWLVWVYAHLYNTDGVDRIAVLLTAFLLLAIAGWALGRWPARWTSSIAAILIIVFAIALPLLNVTVKVGGPEWKPWTPDSFAAARASGKPIFIDYTAAWCLSCKVNEKAVLDSADVDASLLANNFILLRADWTQYDPAITAQLSEIGRSGVPTYVIYPAGKTSNPDVLPELLTKNVVLKAIEKDTKQ